MDKSIDLVDKKQNVCTVQQFYKGKVVFLTGGTGFLGKLLIHKLIRLDVKEIVLLARPKKGKTIDERMEKMFNDAIFSNLSYKFPNFRQQIQIFDGDMQEKDMAFTEESQAYLINNAQIVLHAAADVRFDQTIKNAVEINVRGTRDLLKLVTQFKKLEAFVFVSTAYSNCPEKTIKECFYAAPANPEEVIKMFEQMPDFVVESFDKIRADLIRPWPNAYSYSKALTEDVVRGFGKLIPVAVVRPSIIVSTFSDPVSGWSDNIYGLNGVIVGAAVGILRVIRANKENKVDVIPADIVVDTILAAIHRVSQDSYVGRDDDGKLMRIIPETKIYNCVSFAENPIKWKHIHKFAMDIGETIPPMKTLWIFLFTMTRSKFWSRYYNLLHHMLPALIIDSYLRIINRTPRLLKTYKKIEKFTDAIEYFSLQEWAFENKNTVGLYEDLSDADKQLFPCTAKKMVWEDFFHSYLRGIRLYILKEPTDNQVEALKRYNKFKVMHQIVVNGWRMLILLMCYLVFRLFGLLNFY